MRNLKQRIIFSLLILSLCYIESTATDSSCGDWEPYKDEKCFKVLDKYGAEDKAEKTCNQEEKSATLVIIRSKDEQDFLSNLVFKTYKFVDNVWIGVKYNSNKFKWIDDSELSFTNWDERSPKNKTDDGCVQMQSEEASVGKWIDVPCYKKNLVVCQKMQNWSIFRLQKSLLDTRQELKDSLEDARNHIKNIEQNPFPIGFIYVQLPNEKSPTEIWPWMTWNDVSSTYAGVFFRVTGGEASSFGQIQQDNAPRLSRIKYVQQDSEGYTGDMVLSKGGSGKIVAGNVGTPLYYRFDISDGEVRPRNMAIRVWKRTK